jgi:hypothetical protein
MISICNHIKLIKNKNNLLEIDHKVSNLLEIHHKLSNLLEIDHNVSNLLEIHHKLSRFHHENTMKYKDFKRKFYLSY